MEFLSEGNLLIFALLTLWTLPWKGVALWKSARLYHKWWFIILLVVNTLAILEIIYIFFVAKKIEKLPLKKNPTPCRLTHVGGLAEW